LEKRGMLTPIKVGRRRFARVYYELDEVLSLIARSTR
jgi:hypothetical protein